MIGDDDLIAETHALQPAFEREIANQKKWKSPHLSKQNRDNIGMTVGGFGDST